MPYVDVKFVTDNADIIVTINTNDLVLVTPDGKRHKLNTELPFDVLENDLVEAAKKALSSKILKVSSVEWQ